MRQGGNPLLIEEAEKLWGENKWTGEMRMIHWSRRESKSRGIDVSGIQRPERKNSYEQYQHVSKQVVKSHTCKTGLQPQNHPLACDCSCLAVPKLYYAMRKTNMTFVSLDHPHNVSKLFSITSWLQLFLL